MSDSQMALGKALQNFGGALQNYNVTVYEVEAKRLYNEKALQMAAGIESFAESIRTRKDHGVPGGQLQGEKGWMGDFDKLMEQYGKEIEKLDNPMAQQQLRDHLEQTKITQGGRFKNIQFEQWADTTKTQTHTKIKTGIDAGASFDMIDGDLKFLRSSNLISEQEYKTHQMNYAQLIHARDLKKVAIAAFEEAGGTEDALASAELAIADYNEGITPKGSSETYAPSEQVKELAKKAVADHFAAQATIENGKAGKMLAEYRLQREGTTGGVKKLTHTDIENMKMTTDDKYAWHQRLDGVAGIAAGASESKNNMYKNVNMLKEAVYAVERGEQSLFPGGPPYLEGELMADGETRKKYPITPEGVRNYKASIMEEWYTYDKGAADEWNDLDKRMDNPIKNPLYLDRFKQFENTYKANDMLAEWKNELTDYCNKENPSPAELDTYMDSLVKRKGTGLQLLGAFTNAVGGDDDDKIMVGIRNGTYDNAVREGSGGYAPFSSIHKTTLDSLYAAAHQSLKNVKGVGDVDKMDSSWQPMQMYGKVAKGKFLPTKIERKGDGSYTMYQPTLGEETDGSYRTTWIREEKIKTIVKNEPQWQVKRSIYDPVLEEWFALEPGLENSKGWAMTKAQQAARNANRVKNAPDLEKVIVPNVGGR